jgi:hypothetical protein
MKVIIGRRDNEMSQCNLDHSLEDVQKKLEEQAAFLPSDLYQHFNSFLHPELGQDTLNEAFHLLKKYDLASSEEQKERNEKIKSLLNTFR